MNTITLASGVVSSFEGQYTLSGVTVVARLPAGFPDVPGAALSEPLEIGRAMSNSSGAFEMQIGEQSPGWPYLCLLQQCAAPNIELRCIDADNSVLAESSAAMGELHAMNLSLAETQGVPGPEDWQALGARMTQSQVMRLDALVDALTGATPSDMFAGWTVRKRLDVLQGLEDALLDPGAAFAQTGVRLRMSQLQDPEARRAIQEHIVGLDVAGLDEAFQGAVLRSEAVGGAMASAPLLLDLQSLAAGNARAAVSAYLGQGRERMPRRDTEFYDHFPWLRNPLAGYRDYLLDVWVQRATHQLHQGGLLDAEGAVQQLVNRFHQDFATRDVAERPANEVAAAVMLRVLTAATGTGFGFGVAPAAITPQGGRTHREYLDDLISLTGKSLRELENRYRLELSRSDLEMSSPVQQNIDTLRRFFTDSFQSPFDPFAILPPLTGNGLPIINEHTYPGQQHSPFFWQYEEWLERDEPFYAENFFDIRRLFKVVNLWDESSKTAIWGRTMPLAQVLAAHPGSPLILQLTPPKAADVATKQRIGEQWARMLVELQELVDDAHKAFFAGSYAEAERKYVALTKTAYQLRILVGNWQRTAFDDYNAPAAAAEQRTFGIKDPTSLEKFEDLQHVTVFYSTTGKFIESEGKKVPYLIDLLLDRLLPTCLSETRLALGKYRESIQGGTKPYAYDSMSFGTKEVALAAVARFAAFSGPTPVEPGAKATPTEDVWWVPRYRPDTGSLAFATTTEAAAQESAKGSPQLFPANAMEKAYFRLKLGNAILEWADQLFRSDKPQQIQRARELYKGALYLHGEDPEIAPAWDDPQWWKFGPVGMGQPVRNPQLTVQIQRARIGFELINAGLNYYGFPRDYVPPVRYRVLRESARSLAASAKSTQSDYLSFMSKYEQAILDEMTAANMVEKSSYAIGIADEQVQIAQFAVGEAKKQVEGVKAQIAAKKKEIADSESFFSQIVDFAGGMKDAAKGMGESVIGSMSDGAGSGGAAAGGSADWGGMYKVISSKGGTSAATAGLTGGMAMMAGYGAFVYAGVTSMQSLADGFNRRRGELVALEQGALPAAEKMVVLKQREVKIAGLQRAIAQADYALGRKLLAFYDYRFLSKAFWQQMAAFANRLMRRYLDLGGRMAWFAERALAFETDTQIRVVSFDYFPKNLRGVTGADTLQLHLAEIEASRVFGLSQTIPVKHTVSLMRDFPIAFGQLKTTGRCSFATTEAAFPFAWPGVHGYRLRCVSIGATYADDAFPRKGMLSNSGYSVVSRANGTHARLLRYPDALPLSEFNMRGDMALYDLPDETLLPFEGSGIESTWEFSLSRLNEGTSLESLTDVLVTFDMRASYSAALDAVHRAALPGSVNKGVLLSGGVQTPGAIGKFRKDGGALALTFRPGDATRNSVDKKRTVSLLALMLSGVAQSPIVARLSADTDAIVVDVDLSNGIAVSNAGFLAAANGGVPLPLNGLTGLSADQTFTLTIDAAANPGADFSTLFDVQMLMEYEVQL